MDTFQEIQDLFHEHGGRQYFGEPVSVLEHSLQAAALAREAGASDSLVAAALLHDVGHLLHAEGEGCAEEGLDARHEVLGARWLAMRFGAAVSVPVALHVKAKRYLCGSDPAYLARLSQASRRSLELQGGPLAGPELETFRQRRRAEEALQLRSFDDAAKVPATPTPALEKYRSLIEPLVSTCAP